MPPLVHAEAKRQEVLVAKKVSTEKFEHICDDFKIVVKTAEDLDPEISSMVRSNLSDLKINLAIKHDVVPNWEQCDLENIRRKIKAVMQVYDEENKNLNDVVHLFVSFYINGLETMNCLRVDAPDIHLELYKLEQSYKQEVQIKTKMSTNHELNKMLFDEILEDFEAKLRSDFSKILTEASIEELEHDYVVGREVRSAVERVDGAMCNARGFTYPRKEHI